MNSWAGLYILLSLAGAGPEKPEERPPLEETIVVTASGQREEIVDSVSLVSSISREELRALPASTLDNALRRVPGFSLFRRSSSLAAHPTTQGVSLRGIGPSGASRSLVLLDGIPLNDPFGGWIYWNRIPVSALEAVEVARGGGSQLYGSSALGGTLQLLARRPGGNELEARFEGGRFHTFDGEATASGRSGNWSYLASGRVYDSDGFFVVREELRGSVDRPLDLGFQTFFGRFAYKGFHVSANLYHEDRGNGTELQRNSSRFELFEAGLERAGWNWSFHIQNGLFENAFSRISADRSSEVLTARQRFDTVALGTSFARTLGDSLRVGGDWRRVEWSGNSQNLAGLFLQDIVRPHPRLDVLLGVRFDAWENRATQGEVNPRAGIVYRAFDSLTLRSSVYRGFRAPTLNELFRPFRVGNAFTLANDQLGSESVRGVEGGFDWHPAGDVLLRFNAFFSRLDDPVGNVTLETRPDGILRQRRNLGRVDIQGAEAEVHLRRGFWRLRSAYLYSHSQVKETGLRLPQAPLHQASAGLFRESPSWMAGVEARFVASQFNDDLNSVRLGGYALFDLVAAKPLSERWEAFVSLENVLGRDYAFDLTPVERLGAPRLARLGIRMRR